MFTIPSSLIPEYIGPTAAIGAMVFAGFAAWAAARSAKAAEKAIKNDTITRVQNMRYSKTASNAKIKLRRFFKKKAKRNRRSIMELFEKEKRPSKHDNQRRSVTRFYRELFDLRLRGFVTDKDMLNHTNWSDLDILLEIIMPLEIVAYNKIPNHPKVTLSSFRDEVFAYFSIYFCHHAEKMKRQQEKDIGQLSNREIRQLKTKLFRQVGRFWHNRKLGNLNLIKYVDNCDRTVGDR